MVKRENVAPCYCAALRFRLVPGDARGLGRSRGRTRLTAKIFFSYKLCLVASRKRRDKTASSAPALHFVDNQHGTRHVPNRAIRTGGDTKLSNGFQCSVCTWTKRQRLGATFLRVCVCCVLVPVRHVILSAVFGAASRAVRCREWLVATKEEPSRVRMK